MLNCGAAGSGGCSAFSGDALLERDGVAFGAVDVVRIRLGVVGTRRVLAVPEDVDGSLGFELDGVDGWEFLTGRALVVLR